LLCSSGFQGIAVHTNRGAFWSAAAEIGMLSPDISPAISSFHPFQPFGCALLMTRGLLRLTPQKIAQILAAKKHDRKSMTDA
jgi:hypothetical protein